MNDELEREDHFAEEEEQEFQNLVDEQEAVEEQEPVVEEQEEEIPEKYRNKSLKEVVQMHQESEKLIGRQGSEMGELRRTFDAYVQAQLAQQKQTPQQREEIDFYAEPEKAIERSIDQHPEMARVRALSEQLSKEKALLQLRAAHPDFQTVIGDAGFRDWVAASPVRSRLFVQADKQFDFDAANELITLYKERKNIAGKTKELAEEQRKQGIKAASTGSSRGTGEKSPKVFREADIQELIAKNHDRYLAMLPEITKAYLEGRVR